MNMTMTSDETIELAHREAWRYKKSSDPHHSDTYPFNISTLLEFARKLLAAEREECAKECDFEVEPKFASVSCSQCGQEFGPGDHGFSHCENHRNETPNDQHNRQP